MMEAEEGVEILNRIIDAAITGDPDERPTVVLARQLIQAEARRDYWKQLHIDVMSALNHHLSPRIDPCQDRGVEWPCDVATALNPQLRLRTANAVPHTEVAHASREGPAEVQGDEVPASAQRGSEQAVEPGAEGTGGDQGEVRGGGRA